MNGGKSRVVLAENSRYNVNIMDIITVSPRRGISSSLDHPSWFLTLVWPQESILVLL